MKTPRRVAVAVLCAVLLPCVQAACSEPPAAEESGLVLSLSDSGGTRLFSAPARPGKRFGIVFTHSLMLSAVEEIFEVLPDGRFRLVETRYEDFGAGLPYEEAPGQKMRFENGKIILDGYTAEFTDLWLRVGHIADHRLLTPAGETIHLKDLIRPGAAIRMRLEK